MQRGVRAERRRPWRALAVVAAVGSLAGMVPATARPAPPGGPVVFHVFDASGARVGWSAFRAVQQNGHGPGTADDVLVDPATLEVVAERPLAPTGTGDGDPSFTGPGRAVALALAWPGPDGYSSLILDVPGPGTWNFTALAANQAGAALDSILAGRPGYAPSTSAVEALAAARAALAALRGTSRSAGESVLGAAGARALAATTHATATVLADYGVSSASRAGPGLRPAWGVTFDSVAGGPADLATVRDLVAGDPRDGWVRIVFDADQPATAYVAEVDAARAAGLHVLGELVDSSDMARMPFDRFRSRVVSYVATLAGVEAWEVGNEVNGDWLGRDVVAKVSFAATWVKTHSAARTLLTLYWDMGGDDATHSTFSWAKANLTPALRASIDDIGLSLYPEDHPLGASLDRVMSTLHATFPSQRIGISELDYWLPDTGHTWWWGSPTDPTGAGRRAVAAYYQAAVMGWPWSAGGTFWWAYLDEALPRNELWSTLAAIHARAVTGSPAPSTGAAGPVIS